VGRCRLGFPIALVLAWALELTPEGIRRTPAETPESVAAERQEAGLSRAGEPHDSERVQDTIEDRPCVVVLPFSNLGGEPENEYFNDGVTEADVASRRR
jgi:hypothetical protein